MGQSILLTHEYYDLLLLLMTNNMTAKAASRIQSHADKTGTKDGFKERAQSVAAKNGNKK